MFPRGCQEAGARVHSKAVTGPQIEWGLLGPLNYALGPGHSCKHMPFPLLPSMCLKSQIIDLRAEGYWEELLDKFRPDIVVKDW